MGSMAFITEPEASTSTLTQVLLLARLPAIFGSSSPAILTKPPRGRAFMEYIVSFRLMPNRRGGKPMPNSSTLTPVALAVKKCPHSWARTSTIRTARKATMVISISIGISYLR